MKWLFSIFGGLLMLVMLAATGVSLFYIEENYRGSREWEAVRQELRSAGDSPDFSALIPPVIPDDQNLAALRLFQIPPAGSPDASSPTYPLRNASMEISPNYDSLPKAGAWLKGETTDMGKVQKYISDRYEKVSGPLAGDPGLMEKIDALCPALSELRHEATLRPQCRFAADYEVQPPYNRRFGPTTDLIKIAQIYNLHSLAALDGGHSDIALQDVETVLKLDSGLRQEPVLISGLVAVGVISIQLDSVWEGLKQHVWTDAQLSQLEDDLLKIDFLADYQLSIRGEATGFFAQTMDHIRDHRSEARLLMTMTDADEDKKLSSLLPLVMSRIAPGGWFDMTKAQGVRLYFRAAREVVDPSTHRVYPDSEGELLKASHSPLSFYDLPGMLFGVSSGPVLASAASFAEGQFRIDAMAIACALERYRLAHGTYPDRLSSLAAYVPRNLPDDPMTGTAYIYRLNEDGNYLLYSVGWNQVDDGGKVAYKANTTSLDREHGDWVLPCPN